MNPELQKEQDFKSCAIPDYAILAIEKNDSQKLYIALVMHTYMKLFPYYSYEYNCVLNPQFSESEQIKNFASLLTDKDRFLALVPLIEANEDLIEEKLGFSLPSTLTFYIVRAERFKSFSEPITIEYSLLPEEMLIFLLKEVLKVSAQTRFPDEVTREQYLNALIDTLGVEGEWGDIDVAKFAKNMHVLARNRHPEYTLLKVDYSTTTLREYVEELYHD